MTLKVEIRELEDEETRVEKARFRGRLEGLLFGLVVPPFCIWIAEALIP